MPGVFEPTTGDMGPEPQGGSGAAGGIIGTNPLQSVVEKFAGAVTTLGNSVSKLPSTGMGEDSQAGQFKLFPGMSNPFESHNPSYFGGSSAPEFGQANYFGSGGATNGGAEQTPPPAGGGGVPGAGAPQQQTPGGGQKPPTMGGTLGSAFTYTANLGLSALSGQNALNTYAFQSSLMGSSMSTQQMMQQAVGTFANSNGGTNLNFTGQSTQDIAQQTAILQQIAGSANITGTAAGRAGLQGTNALALANPAMSGTAAAQQQQNMMMPQTSLRMRMMGYPVTPRQAGVPGGANSNASTIRGMLQYMNLGNRSNKQIAGTLQPGGMGYVDLTQGLGMSGQQASQEANQMLVYNALFKGGTSGQGQEQLGNQQAQQLINQYTHGSLAGQKQAGQELQKYGIPQSNLQALRTKAGAAAGAAGDLEPSYAKGLQDSIKALNTFKGDLMHLADMFGLNGPLGAALGAGSQLGGPALAGYGAFKVGKKVLGLGKKLFGKSKSLGKDAEDAGGDVAEDAGGDVAADVGADTGVDAAIGSTGVGLPIAAALAGGQIGSSLLARTAFGKTAWGKALEDQMNPISDLTHPGKELHDEATVAKDAAKDVWSWLTKGSKGKNADKGKFIGPTDPGGAAGAVGAGMVGQKLSRNVKFAHASATAKKAVAIAEQQIGTPYKYGEEQPGKGFDCAGLTQYAYKQAGVDMPRTSQSQYEYWKSKNRIVNIGEVIEGDLVFAKDAAHNPNGHVGMMVTGNKIVVADSTGTPVRIRNFQSSEWAYAARPSGTITGFGQFKKTTGNTRTAGTSSNSSLDIPGQNAPGAGGQTQGPGSGAIGGGLNNETIPGSSELTAITSATSGGTSAGSGYYGMKTAQAAGSTTTSSSGGASAGSSNINSLSGELTQILKDIGAPASSANMASMTDWSGKEGFKWPGGGAGQGGKYNPLNTEETEPGSTAYNSTGGGSGVQNYPNATIGATANAAALNNGRYSAIVQALKAGTGLSGSGSFSSELLTWSGGGYSSVAEGGDVPDGVTAWVGERGPELVHFQQSGTVLTAAQSQKLAQGTVSKQSNNSNELLCSTLNPVFGGGMGSGNVTLNFTNGAIAFTQNTTQASATPTGNFKDGAPTSGMSGREQVKQTKRFLDKLDMYDAIASGQS